MKLKVGMFIRTPLGIDKIIYLRIQDEYGCNYDTQLEHNLFLNNEKDYISIDGECFGKEEIKTSYKLLGNDKEPCLIEPGDYVDGEKVIEQNDDLYIKIYNDFYDMYELCKITSLANIKSIVTKEQFSSMEYKINE